MSSEMNKDLRICIPIPRLNRGGMYRFLEYFREWLEKNGIEHTEDINDKYDILFTNSFIIDPAILKRQKKRNPKLRIIQRMDGSARDYGRFDDADTKQSIANLYSDLSIFQSEYSKYATTQKFKVVIHEGPIINNPVDLEAFNPDGQKLDLPGKIRVCSTSFSTNPKKGTWRIGYLAEQNPDVDFICCGHFPDFPDVPNIHLMGHMNKDQIAQAIRSCHVYLFLSENESCANVLTESLASGLPVIYLDSGGNAELVGDCGKAFTDESFRDDLMEIMADHAGFSARSRERALALFAPEQIFPRYWEAISNCQRLPMPSLFDILKLARAGYPVIAYPNLRAVPRKFVDLLRRVYRKGKAVLRGGKD